MNEYLTKCNEIYTNSFSSDLSSSTKCTKTKCINYFVVYLDSIGIETFTNFDFNVVYQYINDAPWATQTKSYAQFTIRDFFNVMYKNKETTFNGKDIFPTIFTNKRERVMSFYAPDEVKAIIDSIDISKPNGVRDKCMITLAAQSGLRRSDIIYLKFDEIKWDKNLIEKIQMKTKLPVSVPLPINIKFLLLDYLKNHRPQIDSEYIFIYPKTMSTYSVTELYFILSKYIKKAKIDMHDRKRGPHALRFSLASNLLSKNTPMPVITGILGHKNLNTTSKYLSIDIESLRNLSLEV